VSKLNGGNRTRTRARRTSQALSVPSESDILAIANQGEDQLHEFKASGVEAAKLTREIAAMLNTSGGGMILYGIGDDGVILGSDVSKQRFDQALQNSIRSITPAATVTLHSVTVVDSTVLVIIVPPWNRRDVYQLQERVLIRRGTNVFAAKPDELRDLHRGTPVV
jgi:predicted HTH transcriptional regulator